MSVREHAARQIRVGPSKFLWLLPDRAVVASTGAPLGVIWDVDPGSYHLVIYRVGVLGLHVRLRNRIGFASQYVLAGGAPTEIRAIAPRRTREERRLYALVSTASPQDLATTQDRAFFIDQTGIQRITLRYRVGFSAIDIQTTDALRPLTYKWTPSMNQLGPVRSLLSSAFGDRFDE